MLILALITFAVLVSIATRLRPGISKAHPDLSAPEVAAVTTFASMAVAVGFMAGFASMAKDSIKEHCSKKK